MYINKLEARPAGGPDPPLFTLETPQRAVREQFPIPT